MDKAIGILAIVTVALVAVAVAWQYVVERDDRWVRHNFNFTEAKTGRWNNRETKMNALKLALLCYRYEYPADNNVFRAPVGMSPQPQNGSFAILDLKRDGFIETTINGYKLTAKGNVFVKHLLAQPEPVAVEPQWKMPEAKWI